MIPAEKNGNPLQYSCLENPMDRGVWKTTVHSVTQSDMTEVTWQGQTQSPVFNPELFKILKVVSLFLYLI